MKITREIEEQINTLYLEIGTYAGVAREIGCAPSTVKNHIIPDFKPASQLEIQRFDFSTYDNPTVGFLVNLFRWNDMKDIITLSNEEWEELKELQEKEVVA